MKLAAVAGGRAKITLLVASGKQDIDIVAVSEATVRRVRRAFGLNQSSAAFKLSRDPKRA
jgi:hypothetical protein